MQDMLIRSTFLVSGTLAGALFGGIAVLLTHLFGLSLTKAQGEAVVVIFAVFGLAAGIYSAFTFKGPSP